MTKRHLVYLNMLAASGLAVAIFVDSRVGPRPAKATKGLCCAQDYRGAIPIFRGCGLGR